MNFERIIAMISSIFVDTANANCKMQNATSRVLTSIDTALFLSLDIVSRHKEKSINRPAKRYATLFVIYIPPHITRGRTWLNCNDNWHLIALESISR